MTTYYTHIDSPLGPLLLTGDGRALTRVAMTGHKHAEPIQTGWRKDATPFNAAREQLEAYFEGRLQLFDLPVEPAGTDFQRQVWQALREIPFGYTQGYGELAARIGRPGAARAVGMANGRNPIPIIIPCHRVIGADGSLTGYGGGIERKRWLLVHEGRRETRGRAGSSPTSAYAY